MINDPDATGDDPAFYPSKTVTGAQLPAATAGSTAAPASGLGAALAAAPYVLDIAGALATKHPLKSTTIQGLIVVGLGAVLVPLAKQASLTPPDSAQIVDFVSVGATIVGLAMALVGRLLARQPIALSAPKT